MSEPLFGCSNDECASEVSYQPSDLRVFEGEPWCQYCWDDRDPVFITFDDEGDGDEWLKWHDLPPFVPEFQREIDALKQRVRELEEAQRWIPVTERLPESKQWVFAVRQCRNGESYSREERFDMDDWYEDDLTKVTHWMSLPEPPKSAESHE